MMKFLHTIFTFTFLQVLIILGLTSKTNACHRSDVQIDSVVYNGIDYELYLSLNIGAGITGGDVGGIGNTRTFAFNFFGPAGMVLRDYTSALTSDSTQATYWGTAFGPYMGSRFAVGYVDPGTDFTCIYSRAICGAAHTESYQVRFRTSIVPDSVRVLGIEADGNPVGGCSNFSDMVAKFRLLPVVWASFDGLSDEDGIHLHWSTALEINNDHFTVLHSTDGHNFEAIGTVNAAGNSTQTTSYDFTHHTPKGGINFYKIAQHDIDGQSKESRVLNFIYYPPKGLTFKSVGPVPANDVLNITFESGTDETISLRLIDTQGRTLINQSLNANAGNNMHQIDLREISSGVYTLQIEGGEGIVVRKIVKT